MANYDTTTWQEHVLDVFGGLCTLIERGDLPLGLSPACRNVKFVPGAVLSRDGYVLWWSSDNQWITGGGSSNYPTTARVMSVAGYITPTQARRRFFFTENGGYLIDSPAGTVKEIGVSNVGVFDTPLPAVVPSVVLAANAFGRLYLATSDGQYAARELTQYDDVSLSTYSPCAPGRPPDANAFPAGGSIAAGSRSMAVAFQTSTGYLTALSPLATPNFPGGSKVSLRYIPTGPSNVVARYVFFGTQGDTSGANMYCVTSKMVIGDNTTTTLANLDFTEAELVSGLSGSPLVNRFLPVAGLGQCLYAGRLFTWGVERADDVSTGADSPGLVNTTFDGGIDPQTTSDPAGWSDFGGFAASHSVQYGVPGATGGVLQLLADGNALHTVGVQQTGVLPTTGILPFLPGVPYVFELIWRKIESVGTPMPSGQQLAFDIFFLDSAGGVTSTTSSAITPTFFNAGDETWHRFTVIIPAPGAAAANVRIDLSTSGTVAGSGYQVNHVRLYPQGHATWDSNVFASDPFNPEAIDASAGLLNVSPGDGQTVRVCFPLRNSFYIAKDRKLFVTSDTGATVDNWPIDAVSDVVGTPSPRGVALGDGYAIIAGKAGIYHLMGGAPEKISQEIEPTWSQVDWSKPGRLFSFIDDIKKLYRVSAPMLDGTQQLFTLDFVEGFDGPISSPGNGRKWSVEPASKWTCAAMVEGDSTQLIPLYGGGETSGYDAAVAWGSRTFDATNWASTASPGPTVTAGQADSRGRTTATKWVFGSPNTMQPNPAGGFPALTVPPGDYRVWTLAVKGSGALTILPQGCPVDVTTFPLNGTWQRLVVRAGPGSGGALMPQITFPAGTFYVNDFIVFNEAYDQGSGGVTSTSTIIANSSQQFDPITWSVAFGSPFVTPGQVDPRGGTTATRWDFLAPQNMTATFVLFQLIIPPFGGFGGWGISLKGPAGATITFPVTGYAPGVGTTPASVVCDGNWNYYVIVVGPNANAIPMTTNMQIGFPAGSFYLDDFNIYNGNFHSGFTTPTDIGWVATTDPTAHSDFFAAVDASYETASFGEPIGASKFGYLVHRVRGQGTLNSAYIQADGTPVVLLQVGLSPAPVVDPEIGTNLNATQVGVRVGSNELFGYFSLKRMALFTMRLVAGWMRGHN